MKVEPGQWLHVEGVELQCTIGVTEKERRAKQRIVINLQLEMDFGEVSRSDSIDDTVDYRVVTRRTIEVAEKSSFRLIETLAISCAGRSCLNSPGSMEFGLRCGSQGL
jgi:FolB domain-containing protein